MYAGSEPLPQAQWMSVGELAQVAEVRLGAAAVLGRQPSGTEAHPELPR